jgi:sugar lactone lactonase YvrE
VLCAALTACLWLPACEREPEAVVVPPRSQDVRTELTAVLERTLDSGMAQLNGLAVDGAGRIYLAGSDGVRVLGADGNAIRTLATEGPAQCVDVDAEGAVYVGLWTEVVKFNAYGEPVLAWGEEGKGPGQFGAITGIEVAGPNVYVADAGNRLIHRFDLTGDFIGDIGGRDPDAGELGLICPSFHLDCEVDGEGVLHVNNPGRLRVERYKPDGELLGWWGSGGTEPEEFCGCCNPTDIALTPDGRIVTSEKGIPRVKLYDSDGRLLAYVGRSTFSAQAAGMDLAVDAQGRIYVADPGDGKVRVFSIQPADDAPAASVP